MVLFRLNVLGIEGFPFFSCYLSPSFFPVRGSFHKINSAFSYTFFHHAAPTDEHIFDFSFAVVSLKIAGGCEDYPECLGVIVESPASFPQNVSQAKFSTDGGEKYIVPMGQVIHRSRLKVHPFEQPDVFLSLVSAHPLANLPSYVRKRVWSNFF